MIQYQNINPGESGLSVRTKLNLMFKALIDGSDGVNALWKELIGVNSTGADNAILIEELKEEIQNLFNINSEHIDREVNNLLSYINSIEGGVNGFAEDTSFNPSYPTEVAATVIGVGPGTFTYMKDQSGNPIKVDTTCIVIFFKGAGVSYWKYTTVLPTIVNTEVTDSFGDSESKTITQRTLTEHLFNNVGKKVSIADLSVLDDFIDPSNSYGWHLLVNGGAVVGHLFMTKSSQSNVAYQVIFGGFRVKNGELVLGKDSAFTAVVRIYNHTSVTSGVERGTWGKWHSLQDDTMTTLSETDYAELTKMGIIEDDRFYFVYEDE